MFQFQHVIDFASYILFDAERQEAIRIRDEEDRALEMAADEFEYYCGPINNNEYLRQSRGW